MPGMPRRSVLRRRSGTAGENALSLASYISLNSGRTRRTLDASPGHEIGLPSAPLGRMMSWQPCSTSFTSAFSSAALNASISATAEAAISETATRTTGEVQVHCDAPPIHSKVSQLRTRVLRPLFRVVERSKLLTHQKRPQSDQQQLRLSSLVPLSRRRTGCSCPRSGSSWLFPAHRGQCPCCPAPQTCPCCPRP